VEVQVPEDTSFISRNFIINIQQLRFERAGLYGIDVAVASHHIGSIPLLVRHIAPATPPAAEA